MNRTMPGQRLELPPDRRDTTSATSRRHLLELLRQPGR